MKLRGQAILILSPEAWGSNFVSKHHYAAELAECNTVFFSGPPVFGWPRREPVSTGENVTLLRYPKLPGANRLPFWLRRVWQWLLARIIIFLAGRSFDVVWSFDPYAFQALNVFPGRLRIYHGVDIHDTSLESQCVATADIAFFSSDILRNRHVSSQTPTYQINHGLSKHFLPLALSEQPWQRSQRPLRVGLVGNLHYQYLDYPTLFDIVGAHQDLEFFFVGPREGSNLGGQCRQEEVARLSSFQNVRLLGSIHPSKLPALFEELDLFLMCYRGAEVPEQLANPHKILEFLSAGRVVVCHYIDQYREHRQDLVAMADTSETLLRQFAQVVEHIDGHNHIDLVRMRRNYALSNTYKNQIKLIESLITETEA